MIKEAKGWIRTFTNRQFYPLNPRAADVDIRDIAHALSMKCRYGGMSRQFYSVAEHCVRVSGCMTRDLKMQALLHDAHEAYMPDYPSPIKDKLPHAAAWAFKLDLAIGAALGVELNPLPVAIRDIDHRMCYHEMKQLMPGEDYLTLGPPITSMFTLQCWLPYDAEQKFLNTYYGLGGK